MSAETKKEPAPTDIGTSSKENIHNISITDNSENVNTPEEIPQIVLEALTDTLEDLYSHKQEITEVIENLKKRLDMECAHFRDTMEKIAALTKYIRSISYGDVLTAMDAAEKGYKVENSSVLTFYKECCCEREKAYDGCTRSKMYEVFKAWAKANSEFVPSKSKFWEELAGYLTSGEVDKLFKSSKGYVYPVFTVTVETKTTYREAYGYDNVAS